MTWGAIVNTGLRDECGHTYGRPVVVVVHTVTMRIDNFECDTRCVDGQALWHDIGRLARIFEPSLVTFRYRCAILTLLAYLPHTQENTSSVHER